MITILVCLYVIGSFTGRLSGHFVLANVGQLLITLGAGGLALRQAKLAGWSRAWLLLSAGLLIIQVTSLGHLIGSLVGSDHSTPWLTFVAYLVAYPLIYAGLLLLPRDGAQRLKPSGLEAAGGWLDFVIVLLAGGMAVTFLWVVPAFEMGHTDALTSVFTTANALGDILMLAAVARYALLKQRTLPQTATLMIVFGCCAALASDVLMGGETARGVYTSGGASDAIYMVSIGSLAWAAYCASPRSSRRSAEWWERPSAFAKLLPFAAVLSALILAVQQTRGLLTPTLDALLFCAMALSLVVVCRQMVTAVENGRLQAVRAVNQSEQRFRALVTNSSDVILVTGADTTISYGTPSAERLLDVKNAVAGTVKMIDLLHPDIRASALATIAECLDEPRGQVESEWLVKDAQGAWRHFAVTIANLIDEPVVQGLVLTIRDVEERVRFERQLERQIFYDPLTKLANRVLLRDRLEHALTRASRTGGQLAVLFLDLDDFKLVNDHFGHLMGDALLVEVARRLHSVIRSSDTAARLGGDEFAVLIEDTADVFHAVSVAEKALACLREPFIIDEHRVPLSASIGIASSGGDCTAEELLRNADIAMYSAKAKGKNAFEVFQPGMQVAIRARLEVQADLRRAIANREFVVYYQPIVEIASGRPIGLEALARWQHPTRGLLLPSEFIAVAEKTGQITTLGRQILMEACRQTKAWDHLAPRGQPLTIAVNLSPRQLREPTIVSLIAEAIESSRLEPSQLTLEVTEFALIEDEQLTSTKLWAIKQLGVLLSIDDFGTGYSSLGRLHAFPFDCVKIAKPFIDDLLKSRHRSAMARAIIGLADSLDLYTVAEGIEHEGQRDKLADLGCRFGQGFHFSEPMDAERTLAFLSEAQARSIAARQTAETRQAR